MPDSYNEAKLSEDKSRISVPYTRLLRCCKDATLEGDTFRRGQQAACELVSNLIVRHPVAMQGDRRKAREESSLLQVDGVLTEEDRVLLDCSGWNGDHKALAELSAVATMFFSKDGSIPVNHIRETFLEKHFSILEAPIGSGFVTTSIPMFIIGPEDDSYDFDFAHMPLSSKYAALFTSDSSLESFHQLNFPHVELMNRLLLLNCEHWDVALSRENGPLKHAVHDWKRSIPGYSVK